MDRITHQSPRQQGYGSTSSLRNDSLKHTRKHERKEGVIEQKSKAARLWRTVLPGGADCPHGPHGLSSLLPQTVRTCTADCPALSRGLSIKANITSSSEPRKTDRPRGARGPSTRHPRTVRTSAADRLKLRPTKAQNQNGSKAKLSKNTKNTAHADRPPPPRGLSAPHGQRQKLLDPEGQLPQFITGSPKR
jgi:hypothetical protein